MSGNPLCNQLNYLETKTIVDSLNSNFEVNKSQILVVSGHDRNLDQIINNNMQINNYTFNSTDHIK